MISPDENVDPRSLPDLTQLLSHSALKRNEIRIQTESPPDSDSQRMGLSHTQLIGNIRLPISPPPEEEIRSNIPSLDTLAHPSSTNPRKRARTAIPQFVTPPTKPLVPLLKDKSVAKTTVTQSPNPKPRKHPKNSTKDYIPRPDGALTSIGRPGSPTRQKPRSRRSATPDVPYEPPHEQFTPPRRVVLPLPSSAPSEQSSKTRRSSAQSKSNTERKVIRVKTERLTSPFPLPPIDFSKPTAPPSPTDDPILLVGAPVATGSSGMVNKTLVDAAVGEDNNDALWLCPNEPSSLERDPLFQDRDGSGWQQRELFDDTPLMDITFDESHVDTTLNHVFYSSPGPDKSTGSHIFYSDDDDAEDLGEDEGEYTGRFKFYSVPVKQDPPSSATRARRESWGRPISPFPYRRLTSGSIETDNDVQELLDQESSSPSPNYESGTRVIHSLPLGMATQSIEQFGALRFDRTPAVNAHESGGGSSDEGAVSTGVVEVSSDDPKAAARAAAILKLHHSYIVDDSLIHRARHSSPATLTWRRRLTMGDGNIENDFRHEDTIRRTRRQRITHSGGVMLRRTLQISHSPLVRSIFVPSGCTASAEATLREAKTETLGTNAGPESPSPSRLLDAASLEDNLISSTIAELCPDTKDSMSVVDQTEWTKSDWRRLDTCFTDERIAIAKTMGIGTQMADVEHIDIDAIVQRFLADGSRCENWDRDMLFRRATALMARQRAGKGAPPSPCQVSHCSTAGTVSPVSTPCVVPRSSAPPSGAPAFTNVPSSLLAPRYAYLQEEAVTNIPEEPSSSSSSSTTAPDENGGDAVLSSPQPPHPSTLQATQGSVRTQDNEEAPVAPPSATKRVLSYLSSFLGRSGTTTIKPIPKPTYLPLPLPPSEMRQVRGPVNTPAKKPIPKSLAPRELVHLAETQPPPRPSAPPKAKSAREMVSLKHIDTPRSTQRPRTGSLPLPIPGRTRKDSGGSVKDLVRSFEDVRRKTEHEMARSRSVAARKAASIGRFKCGAL